ncbi:MAG: RND family efflux transporter MFP [Beijerinckiaceae bacterium]|nr:MAG: RND family efflux transporter MFP [Beijerinckiaceae bacterium]
MRLSRQVMAIAILGGGAWLGWSQWASIAPVVSKVPGFGFLAPASKPAGGAPAAARNAPPPMLVEITTVGTGAIIEIAEAVGNTRAFESVVLTAKVSGTVEKISFVEGQEVKAGDELIRLDVAERRADLEAARAVISTTRAQRDETGQKLERAIALRKTGAGTEAQVADLSLQLKTIETNIAAAEARERAAAARLEDLSIRAPFDGRVGLRQISLGALVDNKVTVTTLDDVSRMRLDFSVPETLITKVTVDAPVKAFSLSYPGKTFEGRVAVIDTRIDPVTRSAKVSALIPNPDFALKPGMFMNVSLQVAARDKAVMVPEEAITAEGPRQIAFLVKDGKIERRVVTIGQRQQGQVEVTTGLSVGETIVVRGVQRIRQGMPVQVKPAFPDKKEMPAARSEAPAPPGKKT